MKKLLTLTLILTSVAVWAQTPLKSNEVPAAVLKNYYLQNSKGAKDSVWIKEQVTIYKVNYIDEGQRYEAQYFANGDWIKTYTEIKQTDLPVGVTNQMMTMYPGYSISKSFIELNNDGKFYVLDLVRGKDAISIYFSMSGKFVK
jgi:hypothetical protein